MSDKQTLNITNYEKLKVLKAAYVNKIAIDEAGLACLGTDSGLAMLNKATFPEVEGSLVASAKAAIVADSDLIIDLLDKNHHAYDLSYAHLKTVVSKVVNDLASAWKITAPDVVYDDVPLTNFADDVGNHGTITVDNTFLFGLANSTFCFANGAAHVMETIAHEMTHAYQLSAMSRLAAGTLTFGSADYDYALYIAASYSAIQLKIPSANYEQLWSERDAHYVEQEVTGLLKNYESKGFYLDREPSMLGSLELNYWIPTKT